MSLTISVSDIIASGAAFISALAIVVSLIVYFGQRRLQREANDLQRATSELAKKQLEILVREEKGKNRARLSLELVRDGRAFRFRIMNTSDVEAWDVEFEVPATASSGPIILSEYTTKFPIKKLSAGAYVTLIAAIHLGSPTAYNAILKWTNPDGSRVEEETYVAL